MNFFLSYLAIAEIYALASMSTNLLVGVTGIFSVSQGAIFGIGAYTVGILTLNDWASFPVAMAAALILCALTNLAVALPALRIAGDYFVVTSFGIQIAATAVFMNLTDITGGASGLAGVPPPNVFGRDLDEPGAFILLSSIVLAAAALFFWLVLRSPFGRLINAIREDELAVTAAGKSVLAAKVGVSALSGMFVGLAGGLYAGFLSFIDPGSFDIDASILLLTMIVVGGARTLAGSLIGPALLTALPQVLSVLPIPSDAAGPLRQILYGLMLIAFMLFRPQGIAGRRL
ncbi:branched-chain amino acid ABC transporter permease [Acidisphaera sp. L21]|uniref:branched-chain amino acid ABC transporter permease n=1 Tax=Acidisphaera sp. L21 TaxID=1641851 RepID=UPI00131C1257|nr:branched-chain amino acid ABC transporter permease [Acidisphaera sp. L21]